MESPRAGKKIRPAPGSRRRRLPGHPRARRVATAAPHPRPHRVAGVASDGLEVGRSAWIFFGGARSSSKKPLALAPVRGLHRRWDQKSSPGRPSVGDHGRIHVLLDDGGAATSCTSRTRLRRLQPPPGDCAPPLPPSAPGTRWCGTGFRTDGLRSARRRRCGCGLQHWSDRAGRVPVHQGRSSFVCDCCTARTRIGAVVEDFRAIMRCLSGSAQSALRLRLERC